MSFVSLLFVSILLCSGAFEIDIEQMRAEALAEAFPSVLPLGELQSVIGTSELAVVRRACALIDQSVFHAASREALLTKDDVAHLLASYDDFDGARVVFESMLGVLENSNEPDSSDLASTKFRLSGALRAHGELELALAPLVEAVGLCRLLFGVEHINTRTAMRHLALLLRDLGQRAEAQAVLEELLAAERRVFGESNAVDVAVTTNELAGLLSDQREFVHADALLTGLLARLKTAVGEESAIFLVTRFNLGLLRTRQGAFQEARELFENMLKVQYRLLGREHDDSLKTATALAVVLQHQGMLVFARFRFEDVLNLQTQMYGADADETIEAMQRLAWCLHNEGVLSRAESLYEMVVEREPQTDASAEARAIALVRLGDVKRRLGKLDEAADLLDMALEAVKTESGISPNELEAMRNLALLLHDQGELESALNLLQSVVEAEEASGGEDTVACWLYRRELGTIMLSSSSGDPSVLARAVTLLELTVDALTRWLGEHHHETMAARESLDVAKNLEIQTS